MKTKTKHTRERCAACGGALRQTTITHEERRGTNFYVFQNVPAPLCTASGEVWIEETTVQEIDRLIREGEPIRKVETPVYDFAVAGVK